MSDIPLFEIPWDETDISNVVESVSRGGYWAKGPFVDRFEAGLADYFDVDHALVVNSGTTALECCLRALDIGPRDEVLLPSFTFVATANVVRLVGADPVFVDIERETLGMDPMDARSKLTDRTELILPVHCYGSPCRIEALLDVADEADVPVVEDAAEAFGAVASGRLVGTFGDSAALSFCQNKVLPTGEGGAVLTDDEQVASAVELFRSHGRRTDEEYFESTGSGEYISLGSNYRMPDVVAALGCSQLEKVDSLIEGRRRVASAYHVALESVPGVEPVVGRDDGTDTSVYQLYSVLFETADRRAAAIETLSDRGIASKVYWDPPVHETDYYRGVTDDALPVTTDVAERVLSLPMHPELSSATVERTVATIRSALDA
jgi:perosamine synthetase